MQEISVYTTVIQLTIKDRNNPIKKQTKDLNRQKKNTDGRKAYEKILNITNY